MDLAGRTLSARRFRHTLGVASLAEDLARRHGLDPARARYAALLHDLAKEIPEKQQVCLAQRWHLIRYSEDESCPSVLHGPLVSYWLANCCGLADRDILAAIAHHTLGAPNMSRLEMLIYSADLAEPGREFPQVDNLRQALYHSLEKGTLTCVEHTLHYLEESHRPIHPLTRLTHEDLRRRHGFGT
ncbi:bis(5'-nucleosyl)-tetraphosphatase (symmetrical) YqeK [Acididesulfobacillus acetoxydans]|uniref:bis(5'-nucleosyl)-tetraphosphatase (symmetrical) YqeK n=1 Tax=Acididesulfobacillus acetoxydans TaxID=1561005 RepID=UPI001F0E48BF|nr:bis(5'-nucleosyl)-tetraphosphatase (symmetrical) YqeK [Acididesulfobacillus acetoxydans]